FRTCVAAALRQVLPGKICRGGKTCRAIASLKRAETRLPWGKTCPPVIGTVCRGISPGATPSPKKSRLIRHLLMTCGMARGLLTKLRDYLDELMIAQPILTSGPKPQAQQQPQQPQPQNGVGFQALLSTTDS